MEKIPSELRLIISRKFGSKETWDLDVLLNALQSEFQPILTLDVISIREDWNSSFSHLHFMQAVKIALCIVSFARKITRPSAVVPLLNQRLEELYWDEVAGR